MPIDALFTAPLIVAAVFVASALGKLADAQRAALAFDALKVPEPLSQPWMRSAHPWAELLIALCLVVTSGLPAVVTAIITTALALTYLVLIVRAVRSPEPTDCACFGVLTQPFSERALRVVRIGVLGFEESAAMGLERGRIQR